MAWSYINAIFNFLIPELLQVIAIYEKRLIKCVITMTQNSVIMQHNYGNDGMKGRTWR